MPNDLNGNVKVAVQIDEETINKSEPIIESVHDWSYATKELLDTLPKAWTRGLLYFLLIFVSLVLPWAIFSKIDETGTARGRIEPEEETVKLDAAVAGTVSEIRVKEGDTVKAGQVLLMLESDLVKSDLKQAQDKLEGQLNRLNQLKLLKSQLIFALSTQQQQNKAGELEKQAQIDQAQQNLDNLKTTYNLLESEKIAQLNQAEATLKNNQRAYKLAQIRVANSQREIKRYKEAWEEGIASEIQVVEKEDIAQEKQGNYEQSQSDVEQAKLRLAEQQSIFHKSIKQAKSDIEQAELRLKEQQRSLQTLIHSNELARLKIEEQLKNIDTDTASLKAEIALSKSQIQSLQFQLSQRTLKAPVSGVIFQLPIQQAGAVVQPGTRVAEIASQKTPLILRAQMPTTESGSLKKGLPVKIKFDAYPYQDYELVEGKLLEISPTTSQIDTAKGKVEVYKLEIVLAQTCVKTANQCVALRPGDTATAEVIVRQRRIIDFVLDPFKKLQKGGLKL
ncbi:HlyD family efflux transporter periplasmic adaptor subunit [Gloeothece verrucosa]|uniref:Secretion protein HlyD family protein n=1 Tax=Gloeothece verrucosa (strain PCC 7822) TaxID=497965 RepID=E0UHT1_GLOV7|nr:HlyD family efflux transporter periplasmic adaptor subunit [Gloeothece verrucosa]ADN13338.1 secretion protein HlyD family protein [Gloeothece verrucosa PCC 7822]